MRTLLYILLFNFTAISFAQDPQLFENEWYLQNVVIENIEYFPPNSNALGKVYFSSNQISGGHNYCQEGFTGFILYDGQSVFNIGDVFVYGPTCGDQDILNFISKHFSIYLGLNLIPKNPFTYTLETDNGLITLTVVNMDGDKAIYFNENLSTPEIETVAFSMHPNPVKNELFLTSKNTTRELKIKIFNIEGKLLSTQNLDFEKEVSVDVSNLSSGIYFLNIEDEKGNSTVKKFIKE